jgi:hypothetical protein
MSLRRLRTRGLSRRNVVAGAIAAFGLSGGCHARVFMSIGLFPRGTAIDIPPQVDQVRTTGFAVAGVGAATYLYDPAIGGAEHAERPLSTFQTKDGRFFRLKPEAMLDLATVGMQVGLAGGHAAINADALREALTLSRTVVFPAGVIDLRLPGGFILPMRDGLTIMGRGWATQVVGGGAIFSLPSLANFHLSDIWLLQTTNEGPAIQSYHCNLRNIQFTRVKISVQDKGVSKNNCISIVVDRSPVASDGMAGVAGMVIKDCWFEPGRMGVEIQNHGDGERVYRYRNILVDGTTVTKTPPTNGMGVSLSGWGDKCQVRNGRFVDCAGPCVEIVGADNTTIEGNQFVGNIGTPIAISNMRVVRGCKIIGNTVTGAPSVGLFIEAADGVVITGNDLSTAGGFVIKAKHVDIIGNNLKAIGTAQLFQIDRAQNVRIERNVMRSQGGSNGQPMIVVFNGSKNCVIKGNRMERRDYDVTNNALWVRHSPDTVGLVVQNNQRIGKAKGRIG